MNGGELLVGAAIGIFSFWGGAVAAVIGAKQKGETPEARRVRDALIERERLLGIANLWKGVELDQGGALLRAARDVLDARTRGVAAWREATADLEVAYYAVPVEYREKAAAGEPVPRPSQEPGAVHFSRQEKILDTLAPMIRKGEALVVGPDGKLGIQGEKPCAVPLCEHGRHDPDDLGRAAGVIPGFGLTHSRATLAGNVETWASIYKSPADPRIRIAFSLANGARLATRETIRDEVDS